MPRAWGRHSSGKGGAWSSNLLWLLCSSLASSRPWLLFPVRTRLTVLSGGTLGPLLIDLMKEGMGLCLIMSCVQAPALGWAGVQSWSETATGPHAPSLANPPRCLGFLCILCWPLRLRGRGVKILLSKAFLCPESRKKLNSEVPLHFPGEVNNYCLFLFKFRFIIFKNTRIM